MTAFDIAKVPGRAVTSELSRLRAEFPKTGLYPVILGDDEQLARIVQHMDYIGKQQGIDPAKIVAASREIDVAHWLVERADDLELTPDNVGEWPADPPPPVDLIAHVDILTRSVKPTIGIGLFKVSAAWEVFAHLAYGDWNDCPGPEAQCAMHRHWQQRDGAEVVAIVDDVVQCTVPRPPRDRRTALALAQEQYVYCYDIVDQGTNTISALAAALIDAPYWYFWWD